MRSLPLPQQTARKYGAIALGVAAVAGVAAVGVFILPASRIRISQPGPASAALPVAEPTPPKNPADGVRTDWTSVTTRFRQMRNDDIETYYIARDKAEKERIAAGTVEGEPQPTAAPGPPWRYLGSVVEGRERIALVAIDQKQRFIRAGYVSPDDYRVVQIDPDVITVARGRSEFTVRREKSERGQTLAAGVVAAPVQRGGITEDMINDPNITPAERRRLRAMQQAQQDQSQQGLGKPQNIPGEELDSDD